MIKKLINYLKADSDRTTFIFAFLSAVFCFAYAIYNGVLGIVYLSIWNGSICVYYMLLLFVRALLLVGERRSKKNHNKDNVFILFSFILLIVMTITMVTPIFVLINNKRNYDMGLIPAIAMAAYTTYCIVSSIINLKKASSNDNYYVKQVRLINLIAALMSVLVLQNTLILANDGYNEQLTLLSTISSFVILSMIVIIIGYSFVRYLMKKAKAKRNDINVK